MTPEPWFLPSIADEPWRADALCAQAPDPTLWDAAILDETPQQRAARHTAAKAVCRRCPVRRECGAAVDLKRDAGIRDARLLPVFSNAEKSSLGRPKGGRPLQEINHGTEGGATAHRRRKQKPCDRCRIAENEASDRREKKRKTA